jgi:tRNA pseudouridine55 synthase
VSIRDGLLVVDKPLGPTSHDVVALARRLYQTRAVGHAGTLDPMASGVLLLLLGEATKLSRYLALDEKRYRVKIGFGRSTDSFDADGQTTALERLPADWLAPSKLAQALERERARAEQIPPAISAVQVDGRRAYRLTRSGAAPELRPRPVAVGRIELISASGASAEFELDVSKGYYVRAFARDLGEALGVPAHVAELRRLASGSFTLDEAIVWPPDRPVAVTPLAAAAARCLPVARLLPTSETRARQGVRLDWSDFGHPPPPSGPAAWLGPGGELVAIGEPCGSDYRVLRGFNPVSGR